MASIIKKNLIFSVVQRSKMAASSLMLSSSTKSSYPSFLKISYKGSPLHGRACVVSVFVIFHVVVVDSPSHHVLLSLKRCHSCPVRSWCRLFWITATILSAILWHVSNIHVHIFGRFLKIMRRFWVLRHNMNYKNC